MKASDQGIENSDYHPYTTIPRTLIFVTSTNPKTGGRDVLMLRGAPDKRLWPNRYNGLGGHVEAGEDIRSAARRELLEEAGLVIDELTLRAVINIDTGDKTDSEIKSLHPGVMVFVFTAESGRRNLVPSAEGASEWIAVEDLYQLPLVDDLYELLPRILSHDPIVYGTYRSGRNGKMDYFFYL